MKNEIFPEGYSPALSIRETEVAIKSVKDYFERELEFLPLFLLNLKPDSTIILTE